MASRRSQSATAAAAPPPPPTNSPPGNGGALKLLLGGAAVATAGYMGYQYFRPAPASTPVSMSVGKAKDAYDTLMDKKEGLVPPKEQTEDHLAHPRREGEGKRV
ncbi:unnamed protein product, partial [Mesorhabditis spiculigera]